MDLRATITRGSTVGFKVLWELAKVIVPAMVIINILDKTGVLGHISRALGPVMSVFGLPGEASLVLVGANFVSFYAGMATLLALHLTARQVTVLGIMMAICHGATYEIPLIAKAGARAGIVLAARFTGMVAAGLLLNVLLPIR